MADQQRRGAVPDIAAAVGVLLGGNDAAGGGLKGRGHDKHRPGLTAETEAEGTPAIGAEALHGFKGGGEKKAQAAKKHHKAAAKPAAQKAQAAKKHHKTTKHQAAKPAAQPAA